MATPLRDTAVQRSPRAARSTYREFAPSTRDAARVVSRTWTGVAGWSRTLRLFPDGCTDLVWDGAALTVSGPAASAIKARVRGGAVNLGVRLLPAAAGAVLGRSAHTVRGSTITLRDAWPKLAAHVEALLGRAQCDSERLRLLEEMALERLGAGPGLSAVAQAAVAQLDAGAQVQAVAKSLSIGERDLRRLFADGVGLSPKALQRVFRFQRQLRRLGEIADGRTDAAGLAADLGYADQAHMTRECRRISGLPPVALARQLAAA